MNQVGHFYIDANSAFSIFDLENGLKGLFVSGFRALVVTIVLKKKDMHNVYPVRLFVKCR